MRFGNRLPRKTRLIIALVSTVVLGILFLIPWRRCANCRGSGTVSRPTIDAKQEFESCRKCGGAGRQTLFHILED